MQRQLEGNLRWWNSSDVDRTDISILTMIFSHRAARCYHLQETGEGYLGSFCIISINCLWIYNDLKTKCVIKQSMGAERNTTHTFISKRSPFSRKTEWHGGWFSGVKETSILWMTQSECKMKYKNTLKKITVNARPRRQEYNQIEAT